MGYGVCKGTAGGAVFIFLLVWVLGIISTSIPDWWWAVDSTHGVHEGLWSSCYGTHCFPANEYSGKCLGYLNTVRAFSVMTIILGFLTFVCALMLLFCINAIKPGLVFGFLTVCFSIIPWSVYLGFINMCVNGPYWFVQQWSYGAGYSSTSVYSYYPSGMIPVSYNLTKGSGWCLSVAIFPISFLGFCILGYYFYRCRQGQGCCSHSCPPPPGAAPDCPPPAPIAEPVPVAPPCVPVPAPCCPSPCCPPCCPPPCPCPLPPCPLPCPPTAMTPCPSPLLEGSSIVAMEPLMGDVSDPDACYGPMVAV